MTLTRCLSVGDAVQQKTQ